VTGLLGGLVSSTNVTFTFARMSRGEMEMQRALAFGAVAANAVLYPRVILATAVLNPDLVAPLIPYLAVPALVAIAAAVWGARSSPVDDTADLQPENPLQLRAAIQMAALFQAVLMAVHVARQFWGESGVLTSAAVLGLTDVDALTVSMARGIARTASLETAALAIAIGVLANTALKLAVAVALGNARFRVIVGGTLAIMIVAAAAAAVP
jgi:uncharacterized membrane protein (DUF4010 family)